MQESNLEEEDGDIPETGQAATVESVNLEDFRNYSRLTLSLAPRFNVLSGQNGQGKSNFLESLYLLATTRLLRGQKDAEAVRHGAARAVATAELQPSGTKIGLTIERGIRKRASLNGLGLPRASDLIGRLPC